MEPSSKKGYLFSDDYRTGSNPFYHFPFKISKETPFTATEFISYTKASEMSTDSASCHSFSRL